MRRGSRHSETRALAALAAALLGLGVAACDEAGKGAVGRPRAHGASAAAAVSGAVSTANRLKDDGDADGTGATNGEHVGKGADADADSYSESYYDWDDENVLDYGHSAGAADAQEMTSAVRSYYATAASGDGAAVCRGLSASLARAVPVEYGHTSGLSVFRGKTCPTVMAALLKELHQQLSSENATLKMGVVRVEGANGRVLLGFGATWPNRCMLLRRERGVWKIAELDAETLP